jgi:hypothetical protein
LTDPEYRRWRAETWVAANANHMSLLSRDPAALVAALAAAPSRSALWQDFADTEVRQFRAAWSRVDTEKWGWASRPRPHAPGYELVVFTPTDGVARRIEETTLIAGLQLVMHHTRDGWLVAGPIDAPAPVLKAA